MRSNRCTFLSCVYFKGQCLIGAGGTLLENRPFINKAEGLSSGGESVLASTAASASRFMRTQLSQEL